MPTKYFFNISAALLLGGLGLTAQAKAYDNFDAIQYCMSAGGTVVKRLPYFNTNGPQTQWLQLTGSMLFCQFTSAGDGSRISISLQTLYSTKPTLAALAYYAKPAIQPTSNGANPASFYCSNLGGTDQFGGVDLRGGGWVNETAVDVVLGACIFPDMSSIDSWGLAYNSNGTIRGIDLTTVLRYKPPQPAAVKTPATR